MRIFFSISVKKKRGAPPGIVYFSTAIKVYTTEKKLLTSHDSKHFAATRAKQRSEIKKPTKVQIREMKVGKDGRIVYGPPLQIA